MWANKGTLRDLTKGQRHISFDQSEPETPEIKPASIEPESSYHNQDEERTPEQTQPGLLETSIFSIRQTEQDLMETTEGIADDSSIGIGNSSINLDEQETMEELANASGTEFEIPANFCEQVDVDSHMGTDWPGT
ncbi:putative GATA transcription factor 24-like [Abeliophyllum distichum]|uniref:GATA transcription factor 24-like n=1 Tax=Abeliophyllum distichum TaxID=126358 RepID=A0ABD1RR86_9LAMI